ncbi:MAG: hypothetical protein ABIH82_02995 [Candidatus Woesearchaeota archaeon]
MTSFTILCQLNGGCMGCCGNSFVKNKIKESVEKNTEEFKQHNPKKVQEFIAFRDRAYSYDLRNGVCRNLIEENGLFFCPLHPARVGHDLRVGHCDINHLCNAAKEFEKWHKTKQEKFIKFIEDKKLSNIEYSLKMDNNELLKEFEK